RVEEERPEQERDEEPELVDQQQRGADRPTEHESRAGHDDPSSAPPREQPVPRPTAEQRAQRPAREPPDAELPSYGGYRKTMGALQEARRPSDQAVHGEGYERAPHEHPDQRDRKSTRLNSSHVAISYA